MGVIDDSLDEYTKQLENQLKEYNEIKEIFKKYYVMDNETIYDGCIKMQDEIDKLKEENKKIKQQLRNIDETPYYARINGNFEDYEEIKENNNED